MEGGSGLSRRAWLTRRPGMTRDSFTTARFADSLARHHRLPLWRASQGQTRGNESLGGARTDRIERLLVAASLSGRSRSRIEKFEHRTARLAGRAPSTAQLSGCLQCDLQLGLPRDGKPAPP